jgi:hypothetical protein
MIHPPAAAAPVKVAEEEKEEKELPEGDGWMEVGKKNRTVVTRTVSTFNTPVLHH